MRSGGEGGSERGSDADGMRQRVMHVCDLRIARGGLGAVYMMGTDGTMHWRELRLTGVGNGVWAWAHLSE